MAPPEGQMADAAAPTSNVAGPRGMTESEGAIHVLVTGFGHFPGCPENGNPSWLVCRSLPSSLPPTKSCPRPIVITTLPEPVTVSYGFVDRLVPQLYAMRHFDFVVHCGVATTSYEHTLESVARRTGYETKDVEGLLPPHGTNPGYCDEPADELEVNADLNDIVQRWKQMVPPTVQTDISFDAGLFLCEYIFYASMAFVHCQQQKMKHSIASASVPGIPSGSPSATAPTTTVVFYHVPAPSDPASIEAGVKVCAALIRAVVESKLADKT